MLSFLQAGMETFLWLLHEMLVAGLESVISVGDACRRCKRLRVFLPRESPWTEDPGRLQPIVLQSWTQLKQLSMHITVCVCVCVWASQVAQLVQKSACMQETPVQFLGWEGPLEKG